ncbi:OmpA domain protein [Chitinispirillum alkaliphilum]|nr:OmpA domain protein [Chitinispirillum alkaliphilum]
MKRKAATIAFLLLFGHFFFLSAQNTRDNEADYSESKPSEEHHTTPGRPLSRLELLDRFSFKLDSLKHQISSGGNCPPLHLFNRASSSVETAKELYRKNPDDSKAASVFDICSVLTQAAVLEMEAELYLYKAEIMNKQQDLLYAELHNIHKAKNLLHRSYAVLLEEKLDISHQTLEKEREKARAMMEEAQSRFSELQSELINVSEDARGTIISMSDILFDIGKATLKPELKTSLARIAGILIVYRDIQVLVEGHTDNVGSNDFNMRLSRQRADNVKNFLIGQGVCSGRLSSEGYGFHRPVGDNSTEDGRRQNRRVDLVIQDSRL